MKKISLVLLLVIVIIVGLVIYLTIHRILPGQVKTEGPTTAPVQTSEAIKSVPRQNPNPIAAANQAVVPSRTIALTNLPEHITAIVENYAFEPQWQTAKKLSPADKDVLLQL